MEISRAPNQYLDIHGRIIWPVYYVRYDTITMAVYVYVSLWVVFLHVMKDLTLFRVAVSDAVGWPRRLFSVSLIPDCPMTLISNSWLDECPYFRAEERLASSSGTLIQISSGSVCCLRLYLD